MPSRGKRGIIAIGAGLAALASMAGGANADGERYSTRQNGSYAADASAYGGERGSSGWTGPYIGMGVGAQVNGIDWVTSSVALDSGNTFKQGFPDSATDRKFDSTGIQFNGFLGYNWQLGRTVVGVEGALNGSGDSSSRTRQVFPGANDLFATGVVNTFDSIRATAGFGGSLRGRLGVLVRENVLLYGTAGLAFQQFGFHADCNGSIFTTNSSLCLQTNHAKQTATQTGWIAGFGAEAQLTSHWTARIEYTYAGFESADLKFHFADNTGGSCGGCATTMKAKADFDIQTVGIGIAYKFGGDTASGESIKDSGPVYTGSGYADVLTRPYLFYVGGAIGEYWINSEHTHTAINRWVGTGSEQFLHDQGSGKINGSDVTLSAFLGFEHRRNNMLVGVELDANYIGFHNRTEVAPGKVVINGQEGVADFFTSVRVAHMETLRARLGYTFGHTTLFMTGGLALAEVDFNQSINFPYSSASFADGRQMRWGWVVGGGFERQLSRDVSLRAEYLYADLGRVTKGYTNNCATGSTNVGCGITYPAGFDHTVSYDITTQIARVGLKIAMNEFGGGGAEPFKAGAVPGAYVDYTGMKTDFSGLYISPIAGTVSGQTTFALSRFNTGYNPSTGGPLFSSPYGDGETHKVKFDGFTFGGVLGYQKQFGNLVLGTDVSLQGGTADGKADCSPTGPGRGDVTATCSSRVVFDTAWRVRAGYAMDKWMVYVNGGPAFAKIDNDVSYGGTVIKHALSGDQRIAASYFNEHGSAFTKGWTYGAGIEYEWKPGVIVGLSYNHTQLEDVIVDLRRNDGSTNSRRLVGVDPDVIGSSLKIKLGDTAQAAPQAPPAPAAQQVAAAAAPPPAPAPAAAPAPQRPRPAAARPSAPRPAAAPAPAATPAAAPAVRVAPTAPAAPAAAAPKKPAPDAAKPVDGTPTEPAPQMGKPQK